MKLYNKYLAWGSSLLRAIAARNGKSTAAADTLATATTAPAAADTTATAATARSRRCVAAFAAAAALTAVAATATGCQELIYEDLDPCERHYYVKYIFDMNMNYADAFAAQVHSVKLFVFDAATGELKTTYAAEGDELAEPGYRMEIEIEPGTYELIAWCGMDDAAHFALPPQVALREEVTCRMDRDYDADTGEATLDRWLHPLFHGRVTATLPDSWEDYEVRMPLVKNTNDIILSLQHVGSQELRSDMFTVTLTEANGAMAHNNALLDDEMVTFRPWALLDGTADLGKAASVRPTPLSRADAEAGSDESAGNGAAGSDNAAADDAQQPNFFKAELSTGRLMADRNPEIVVTENATGRRVFTIPLVKYALMFRSERYKTMDPQEYLDRESEYTLSLFLDNKDEQGWVAAQIWINGWRVVLHEDTEMGTN